MRKMDINTICDIMNGAAYIFEHNMLHLLLFIDAATYNKSGNRSQWFVYSAIAELPPDKRYAIQNVVFHSSWSGSNPDFNVFLEKYNHEIDQLINKGLETNLNHYKFKIHLFIADAPARAKGCVCSSFNGKYGCIKCLHPTIYNTKTIYPKLKTVQNWSIQKKDKDGNVTKITYPFKELSSIKIRSGEIYNQQVLEAIKTGLTYKGIKGFSYLSTWVDVPRMVIRAGQRKDF